VLFEKGGAGLRGVAKEDRCLNAPKQGWVKTVTQVFAPNQKGALGRKLYIDAPTMEDVRKELFWLVLSEKGEFPKHAIFLTRRIG
jgi:hypothetical protein